MRPLLFFVLSFLSSYNLSAQDTIMTISHDGMQREFTLYAPSIYESQAVEVPLLIGLHGLNSNMGYFTSRGFYEIADTANCIVVLPQALTDQNPIFALFGPAWNSGAALFGLNPNSSVDDVGFLMAIVDELSGLYNIDQSRIYMFGESMGGFMTNRVACEQSERIAAIGTALGTIGDNITCDPASPVPALHIHGTADGTVPYSNNPYGMDAEELVDHWVNENEAETVAIVTNRPDSQPDGLTVEEYYHNNSVNGADVNFLKVNNHDHSWISFPDHDVDFAVEIWNFVSRFRNIESVGIEEEQGQNELSVFPNPFGQGGFTLNGVNSSEGKVTITSITGREVYSLVGQIPGRVTPQKLAAGIYWLKVENETGIHWKKLLKD